ncbi:hypothetical protein AAEX63_11925 [Luteococcus sp. H138]|uniref:hypothetical protein n=1 Tax=unclassified Luteococcus TaxID=2639923 RepID=UPI00313AD9C4
MPDTLHTPEIDEFELTELAAIAPTSPRLADTDWELTRDDIRQSITATADRRASRWPRLAVAAAAIATVGALGYGALTPGEQALSPAAPASSSANTALGGPRRTIPEGQFATRTWHSVQVGDFSGSGKLITLKVDRVEWLDSRQNYAAHEKTTNGSGDITAMASPLRDLRGLPREPQAMRAWFLQRDRNRNDSRPDDEIIWVAVNDLVRHLGSSATLRQDLMAMLRENPQTTLAIKNIGGRRALVATHTRSYPDESREVSTLSVDAATMAQLGTSTRVTAKNGTLVGSHVAAVTVPEHLVDKQP